MTLRLEQEEGVAVFNVAQPAFMTALGSMIGGQVSIPDWKTYLRWHRARSNERRNPRLA